MEKILIILTAITLLISCSSKKVTTTVDRRENLTFEKVTDSMTTKHVVKEMKAQLISADTAQASIAISAIGSLPEGVKFVEKLGRASVQLVRINDTILITAICDSLQRLIYSYEMKIENYNKKIEQKNSEIKILETKTKEKTYNPFWAFFLGVGTGGLIIVIFTNQKSILDTVLNIIKKLFK
jgi:hypothetical protein